MLARTLPKAKPGDVTRPQVTGASESVRQPYGLLHRSIGNHAVHRLARVHGVIHSPGSPLDPDTRATMEPRFAHDFSEVRVHADSRAAAAAADVNARAFTVGRDIVFGRHQYDPGSRRGARLLAHELAHTIQQGHRRPASGEPLSVSRPSHAAEREAEAAATAVLSGSAAGMLSPSGTAIARQTARDVPLPDLPEGLAPGVVTAIQQHAKEIIRELASFFPNITLMLSIVTKWYEADEGLGQDERFFRPHLDTLLITLDAHAFNAHTTALDEMWHRFAGHSVMQENFLYILRKSYSYRDYSPGPPLRGLLEHEARSADKLRTQVLRGDYKSVDRALDEPWAQNRDDVAVALVTYLADETLSTMAMSAAGRSLLDHLLFELTRGSLGADEGRQARRILSAKAGQIPLAEVERQLIEGDMKIFPYRETGITVFGAAPVRARRLADGRIWVQLPMNVRTNSTYRSETSTLPLRTFTSGIVLPENEFVGVRLYDQGGAMVYAPALYLVQISNQSLTQTLSKIGEVAGLGAGLGMSLLIRAGVEATLAARVLMWADRAALVFGLLGSAVLEHRGWILKNVPPPLNHRLIAVVEIINSVVALYGMVRFVAGMPTLVNAARETFKDWQAWRAAAREVSVAGENRSVANTVNSAIQPAEKEIIRFDQLPAEERAQIISIVGRERTGSNLRGAPGSYELGDLDAARRAKQAPLTPDGPGSEPNVQTIPVAEQEVNVDTVKLAAGAESSTPGSGPVATIGSNKPGTLSVVPTPSASVGPLTPVPKAGPSGSVSSGPVQTPSPGPVIVPMDAEAAELTKYWTSKIASATNAVDKARFQRYLAIVKARGRPTWRQTELEMESYYREIGGTPEVSYTSNREVPRGTPGSTRPDLVTNALVEVKNYRIVNRSKLIAELQRQVSMRAEGGPANIRQQVIILDLRGQTVAQAELLQLATDISAKTGVPVGNIQILIW
jgi:hypothetical protein